MIVTKSSLVYFEVLTHPLLYILNSLYEFHRINRDRQPGQLVITAMSNGVHMKDSKHYSGEAIDLRSNNFASRELKREFRAGLETYLGPKFRVLLEGETTVNEHFHIQVKKGQSFP
jgi:hypothetical protein